MIRHAPVSLPNHDERVDALVQQVRELAVTGVHDLCPTTGPTRRGRGLDISALEHVLEIDPERRRCVAEPGVRFRDLVRATLPLGLVPTVVPELECLTLGGAVAGCAIASSSFRHGGFFDSLDELELLTGAGELLTLTPDSDAALFPLLHGSRGTLGVITRLGFRLVPARPFVRLRYIRHRGFPEFHAALRSHLTGAAAGEVDFVDAIVHAPDHLTLCLGEFVDHAPYLSDYRRDDIYYKSTRHRALDYLTSEHYLFRYDTECHWLTRTIPGLEHPLLRRLLGKQLLGSCNLQRWSRRLGPVIRQLQRRPDVNLDLLLPDRRIGDFYRWYAREPRFFPLWLIPYRLPGAGYPWIADERARHDDHDLLIDCAIRGMPNDEQGRDWSEVLAAQALACGGLDLRSACDYHLHQPHHAAARQRLDPHALFHRDLRRPQDTR